MAKDRTIILSVLAICASTIGGKNTNNKTAIDFCTTASNKPGQCIVLTECKYLYDLITLPIADEIVDYLRKSHCGFNETKVKVCCSLTNNINSGNVAMLSTVQKASKLGIELPALNECGLFSEDRIVPGSIAQLGGYPWVALLEYQKPEGRGFHCGGVLISKRYILTAAHCVSDVPEDWNLFSVRLGEHDTTTDLDCDEFANIKDCSPPVVDVPIETKIIHKNYKHNDVNKYYDLALLRLTKPISFTDYISPICLPQYEQEGIPESIITAGWGANKHSGANGVKKHAYIYTKNNATCRNLNDNRLSMHLRNDQICLVQTRQYQNICNTDSGGVLMTHHVKYAPYDNYFAVGVLSLIPSDCSQEKPLIGIKVLNYLQWILENMLP